jgi:Tfp pilus assembly protein PilN
MAVRAPRSRAEEGVPPIDDQLAVRRRLVQHRRKRVARIERRREQKWARRRFWILIGVLVLITAFLSVTIWEQIQSMFGI